LADVVATDDESVRIATTNPRHDPVEGFSAASAGSWTSWICPARPSRPSPNGQRAAAVATNQWLEA